MKALPIDMHLLKMAVQSVDPVYLDTETGDILTESEIEPHNPRYVEIPAITGAYLHQQMEDFIEEVEDEALQEDLDRWLQTQSSPDRDGAETHGRFAQALRHDPEAQERWYNFAEARLELLLLTWLSSLGVMVREDA